MFFCEAQAFHAWKYSVLNNLVVKDFTLNVGSFKEIIENTGLLYALTASICENTEFFKSKFFSDFFFQSYFLN